MTLSTGTFNMISKACFVLALTLWMASPALAQSYTASIRGIVVDPSGAAVPEATLEFTNQATGERRVAITEPDGRFAISAMLPGEYLIEAQQDGYARYVVRTGIRVHQELWLNVRLNLGNVSEAIEVIAPAVVIDQESAALSTVIDDRQITGLPLDGRNFLELSLLAPGAAPAPEGSASSLRGDFAFTVNGAREDAHSFLLDGIYNVDPKLNTPGVRPPVDAIQEFEVLTGTYDASFGRNAAGQVNVVTRSGGNEFHGTAYGFFRTRSLNSRNFFAPENEAEPDYSREQSGGSIGGPIIANRTFFFADYEHTRLREGLTRVTNVPTLAERRGNFSESLLAAPFNPFSGQPFSDNKVPDLFIHPVGRSIAALYPEPNRATPFANYVSSPTLTDDIDHFDLRVDHNFAGGSRLMTRYSFNDRRFFEPFASAVSVPGYGTDVPRRGQNMVVGFTQPIGGKTIHDFRVGYTRVSIAVLHENRGRSINQELGLPDLSSNPRDFGLSQITVTGFSPLGDEFTTPQESTTDMWQVIDTVTWTRGSHMVAAGFDFRHVQQEAFRDVQSRGFLNFSDRYITGNALADLLLGFPLVTGGAVLDNPQRLRSSAWSAFVQDSWRVRPNLTLTAGLRYEYVAPGLDADDRANLYDPATGGLVQVGTGNMPRGGYEPDRNNWGPRFGLAWTPDAAGGTVIRGGYGIYYNQGALATGEGLYFNAPFFDLKLFVPAPGIPPVTLNDPFPQSYPIALPVSATAYQRDLQTGRLEHWSIGVGRQLGDSRTIDVAYVGSRGRNLIAARDINQPDPSPVGRNLRPNPLFDDITLIESRGHSAYKALQIKFQQRFDRGLTVLTSYTLGDSNDDASGFFASAGDPNFPQDSRNPSLEYGRSSFDVRHRFSTSFAWEMPFGSGQRWLENNGTLSTILADWEVQGIVTLQSGRPFTVALLPEVDNSNTGRSTLGFGANDRPNLVGNPALENPAPERWFNTSAFTVPPFGSFGDAGRNILEGPDFQNVSLALTKDVSVREGVTLQLRAETFNLFNRTNFNLPDAFVGSPTFGQIVSAESPRRCQFGVKLIF
jgi:hypothetical protein